MSSEQFSSEQPRPAPWAASTRKPADGPTARQKKDKEKEEQAEARRKLLIRGGLALLLLLLIGTSYALFKPDEVAQMKAKIDAVNNNPELSRQDKQERIGAMWGDLTPDGQDKMKAEGWEKRRKADNERYAAFFAKSKQQQKKEIRDAILASEKRRKEWEAQGGGGRGGAGGPAGNGGGAGGRGAGGPGGGQGAVGAPADPNGAGAKGKMSQEDKQARRDVMRQNFTPDESATRASYRVMVNQVREEMGLPPTRRIGPPGGFGGRGGFGGFGGGGPPAAPNPPPPAPATGS